MLTLDYQSERHCAKTYAFEVKAFERLDYQSERHCAKTVRPARGGAGSWITSQNDTAPKRCCLTVPYVLSWITSQNDTAPKLSVGADEYDRVGLPVRTTLRQNG